MRAAVLRKAIKIVLITLAVMVGLFFTIGLATVIVERVNDNMHGELSWVKGPDGETSALHYYGNDYYCVDEGLYTDIIKSDVKIGWQYALPFPDFQYYTDGSKNPLYILSASGTRARAVYLRSDYDYRKQTSVIEGTDVEFVFEEVFVKAEPDVVPGASYSIIELTYCLRDAPRLKAQETFYRTREFWYIKKNGECWILTEEFVSVLKANQLI